jgi:cytochrome c oxidase cbb3-type subunit 4
MAIENIFDSASSIMTAVSFTAFLGILWWVFIHKRSADFDEVSRLPFADEEDLKANASTLFAARSALHSAVASEAHSTSGSATSPATEPARGFDAKPAAHTTEARHG